MSARDKRPGVALPVLGGFVLGAATVLLVVWGYGSLHPPLPVLPPASAPVLGNPPSSTPSWDAARPSAPGAPGASGRVPAGEPGNREPSAQPLPPGAQEPTPDLFARHLLLPVQGIRGADIHDTFSDSRGGGSRPHEALDIMAPRGTPVLAVENGQVAKLFQSRLGGTTIYQFDPTSTYAYYYAHLDRYADGLKEGTVVARGQILGYVGSTGDASPDAPHLHFTIFRLNADRHWWQGIAVNPFRLFHDGG